ncbi:MAG: hypothetical protein ACOYD7_06885 [Raoultibacter sp.]
MVLVAIAVPIFLNSLSSAEDAVSAANERAIKAQATADFLTDVADGDITNPAAGETLYYEVTDSGDIKTADEGSATHKAEVKEDNGDYIVEVTEISAP